MTNPKWEEQILVVPVSKLFDETVPRFQGVKYEEQELKHLMDNIYKNYEVKRRGNVEDPTPAENNMEINENYKQPIPYVILQRGEDVFLYERLSGGGEKRLNGNLSIGVGGHMNKTTGTSFAVELAQNMYRELNEELIIETEIAPEAKIVGIINDDENEVGRVHVGILVIVELPEGTNVEVREKDKLDGYFVRIRDLTKTPLYENLESWSQIAADVIQKRTGVKE